MLKRLPSILALLAAALLVYGCASIDGAAGMVQAPRVRPSAGHTAEVAFAGGGQGTLHAWARVRNPNGYAVTLSKIHGPLYINESKAGVVDLEANIKMKAREEKTVPLDLAFGKGEKDEKAAAASGPSGSMLPYRLDGVLTVTAGDHLVPTFGPLTLLEGQARVR